MDKDFELGPALGFVLWRFLLESLTGWQWSIAELREGGWMDGGQMAEAYVIASVIYLFLCLFYFVSHLVLLTSFCFSHS